MKVVACIKQVPFVDQLKFDTKAGRLIREGVDSEINPFDKRALAEAVNLKDTYGAETIVLTMGPPQAESALREALAMGTDRAVHLLGREFAGADTLATARTLALALRRIGFDLILCGKYSTDAETAQVPPMIAEFLDLPQVTGVTRVEYREGTKFLATRETDDGFETVEGELPALMSTAERLIKPIKVAPKDLESVKDRPIEIIGGRDLSADVSQFGLGGSPTWVEAIHSIEPKRKRIIRTVGAGADEVVQETTGDLVAEGLFDESRRHRGEIARPRSDSKESDEAGEHGSPGTNQGTVPSSDKLPIPSEVRVPPSIWTVAEIIEGEIRHVTFELIGRSIELAQKIEGEVAVVVVGSKVERHARILAEHGADKVYVADAPELGNYLTEPYTEILAGAIQMHRPYAVLIPSTANGRDLAPRVAARLGLGLTGDCIGLDIDNLGRLVQLKPAFGGNIVAPILTRTSPAMTTVRPGMLQKAAADPTRRAEVIRLPVGNLTSRVRFVNREVNTEEGVNLDDADVIIGVGMGIGGPESLPLVQDLAHALNARVGATRRVVDAGWLPRQVQIGLTGRSISPSFYIALGVRGSFNHAVGIQRAGTILAINNNPDADIFKQCDYGLVGDWQAIANAMLKALANKKIEMA
jgi:electron transfer flavoprotein alpha subunit